jgi:two-component system response regulator QseB
MHRDYTQGMNIFMVEDDLAVGRALQAVLQNDGHDVTWVRLGADSARFLEDARYDAMLLDLGLPDCDGIELLARLRSQNHTLPVLVITARDALQDRLNGLDGGADDYLIKPFEIPELLARLRAVVRRVQGRANRGESTWTIGDLVLDPRHHSLTRDGALINLSKTEFSLLHTLVRYADRIVTRTELEDKALPVSEGQTLDIHICNLRKKIGEGYIRTVRGVGYMVQHVVK